MDWRVTRAEARRRVLAEDADRRESMPFFRDRPPLTPEQIEAEMPRASAGHALWQDAHTRRPIHQVIAGATPGQIIACCVPYFHAEVCNGGFRQYFSNSTGDYASITIDALRRIGEDERATLMARAMVRFPGGVAPTSRTDRQEALASIDFKADWEPWIRPIEDAYYALNGDDLGRRIREYIAAHPREYFLDD